MGSIYSFWNLIQFILSFFIFYFALDIRKENLNYFNDYPSITEIIIIKEFQETKKKKEKKKNTKKHTKTQTKEEERKKNEQIK